MLIQYKMKIEKILKFTRNYRGLFDERISTYLYRRFVKDRFYSGITWFNEEAISIYYTSTEYIERRIWMLGEYEPEIKKVFDTYVPLGGLALDIGANIGINTIRLSKCVGTNGVVYSFEPIPFNLDRFKKNIELNKINNVKLEPVALGDTTEVIVVDIPNDEENMGAISLKKTTSEGSNIQVLNGDDWVKKNSIDKISFIKIDVEGYEWKVISGLFESIKRFHPKILIEWDLNYLSNSQKSLIDWQMFIDVNKYKIYQINNYDLIELDTIAEAQSGNLLFI